jgi:signal transduction histidine kinase
LIEAQENERNRIARELHDDISQRMALLLISLDKMSHEPSDRVKHVTQQLQEIMKAASEISSDIHNLSHRLHPSKLEVLGLVAAVNGYCRELSAQQGLQIKFTHCESREVCQTTLRCASIGSFRRAFKKLSIAVA